MADSLPVVPEPPARRLERLRYGLLPFVVWVALAAVAASLLTKRTRFVQYVGLAHSLECQISPTITGRIDAVTVSLNERVGPGQIVTLMDDALIDAAIDTTHANLRKLRADLTAAAASLAAQSGQVVTDLLRLQMDEESRRLEALSLQATLSGDTIEIERRGLERQRMAALSGRGLAPRSGYEDAKLAHDELQARTEQTKVLLAQTEAEWQASKARRERYERRLPDGRGEQQLLAPLREAISVEEARLHEVEIQRAALVLRSPITGQVSQVWCGAGQSVGPGDPILTIVESKVRDVIVYVNEREVRRFAPRAPVLLTTRSLPRAAAESIVVSVGESVQLLPQRLWRNPGVPTYGRAVVVAPVAALPLSSGELVDVTLMAGR